MNQFKKDLQHELQGLSLSDEKRQQIAMKAKAKNRKQDRRVHWQYRIVLTAFTFLILGFGYSLLKRGGFDGNSQGAAPIEPIAASESVWSPDFLRAILIIGFFVILRIIIKRRLLKSIGGLPICLECGEQWTFWKALKQSWKNDEVTCPHCAHTQHRVKRSTSQGRWLIMSVPFASLISGEFTHHLFSLTIYFMSVAYFIISLNPYFIELQENDPGDENR